MGSDYCVPIRDIYFDIQSIGKPVDKETAQNLFHSEVTSRQTLSAMGRDLNRLLTTLRMHQDHTKFADFNHASSASGSRRDPRYPEGDRQNEASYNAGPPARLFHGKKIA
jgi:hypothetical protein